MTKRIKPVDEAAASTSATTPSARISKLDTLVALLSNVAGASIAELVLATGWQQHSVRGAIAGAIKKRGHVVTSDKIDGVRCYRIQAAAAAPTAAGEAA